MEIRTETDVVHVETITDYIDSDGKQYSLAWAGDVAYRIVDRDAEGPIWAIMP